MSERAWRVARGEWVASDERVRLTILRHATVTSSTPLLEYLLGLLGFKRRAVKNLLKFGAVTVNDVVVRQFDHPLTIGDRVAVHDVQTAIAVDRLEYARIQIVHEDADLIVVEKPAGLLTVAAGAGDSDTLFRQLNDFLRRRPTSPTDRAHVVHRLDRDTSGLVLLAKSTEAKLQLQAAWPAVEKIYHAIVVGRPEPERGTIETYLTETAALQVFSSQHPTPEGRVAVTHYRLLQTRGDFSLVEIRLETGRKHQIRVHLAGLGCRVAGDRRYGASSDPCRRLALHATSLAFDHPKSNERLQFNSPLPAALHKLFPAWIDADRRKK